MNSQPPETSPPAGELAGGAAAGSRIDSDQRITALDGLRGLAIVMVLSWHGLFMVWDPAPQSTGAYVRTIFSAGWSGVDLFFVLSGFLIGGILFENRRAGNFFGVFYTRRACRILPLYYLILLSYYLVAAWLGGRPGFEWLLAKPLPSWSYATFLQNWFMADFGRFGPNWLAVTWSLAIEEQFYLLAPLLVRWLPARWLPATLGTLVVCAPACRLLVHWLHTGHGNPGYPSYLLLPCRWDTMLIGMLAAWAVRRPDFVVWVKARTAALAWGLLLLGAGLFIFQVKFRLFSWAMSGPGHTLFAVFYGGLILAALYVPAVAGFFQNRLLCRLGWISYGLYMYHQPINGLCHGLLLGSKPRLTSLASVGASALALGLTVVVATLSWRFLERPLTRFGHSFRYRSPAA